MLPEVKFMLPKVKEFMLLEITDFVHYLKSRILSDTHCELFLFTRGLFNNASVSQNTQRTTRR